MIVRVEQIFGPGIGLLGRSGEHYRSTIMGGRGVSTIGKGAQNTSPEAKTISLIFSTNDMVIHGRAL
jgi:hypothetical protein